MNIPITQSEAWLTLQGDLNEEAIFEKHEDFQYLAIVKHTKAGNYIFTPYGPLAENEQGLKKALESLQTLAKEKRAIFIRIEPRNPEMAKVLPKTAKKVKDIDPADTWILDLTSPKEEILTNFSQGTRTRYNTYAKKGITVEKSENKEDIKYLINLQNKLYREKGLHPFPPSYLKAELDQPFASLYLVKYEGKVIAASLFFDFENTRYYMQSAADADYKKLPGTVALLTKAIFDAKEQGMKEFDFWGIAPDGAPKSHPWYGFTEFKKSFGGRPLHFAGTYDLVMSNFRYKIFNLLHKIFR